MNHIEVIEKIIRLRKKHGINQDNMGGMIGVSGNTVSRWENKKNVPSKLAIRQMEKILKFRPRRRVENSDITKKDK